MHTSKSDDGISRPFASSRVHCSYAGSSVPAVNGVGKMVAKMGAGIMLV